MTSQAAVPATGDGRNHGSGTVVIVPIKAFDQAKARLSDSTTEQQRRVLSQRMAARVLWAAHPLPTFVVCDSDEVARWAAQRRAQVLRVEARGLNPALTEALGRLPADRYRRVVIAHADLPRATELAWVADFEGVTIVPDRHGDGTNVMSLPLGIDFRLAYGPGSACRHRQEAARLGLAVRWAPDQSLGWDIDTPDDFGHLASLDELVASLDELDVKTPEPEPVHEPRIEPKPECGRWGRDQSGAP